MSTSRSVVKKVLAVETEEASRFSVGYDISTDILMASGRVLVPLCGDPLALRS